jgi:hypothetical protein
METLIKFVLSFPRKAHDRSCAGNPDLEIIMNSGPGFPLSRERQDTRRFYFQNAPLTNFRILY